MSIQCFQWVGDQLEERTHLNRLQARGTLRLALKKGGLEAETVGQDEMLLLLRRIVPDELDRRGVEDAQGLCEGFAEALAKTEIGAGKRSYEGPEEIFRRVFGD